MADKLLGKVMFIFIIAGIVLSCLHQSSLGSLMLIAPYKVHPLWYTPILPLLFLLSAFAVGYPMVVFESLWVARSFNRRPEMEVLTPLAKFMPFLMGIYLVFKIGDMVVRGTYVYLLEGTYQTNAFIIEVLVGVILPFSLVLFKKIRGSAGWLFLASTLFVLGILMNRINVFLVSYTPSYKAAAYFPALGEIFITIGLIATLMFLYRVFVFIFPVLGVHHQKSSLAMILMMIFSVLIFSPGKTFASEALGQAVKNPLVGIKGGRLSLTNPPKGHPLNNPVINQYSDLYEPVPFKHEKHFKVTKDCTVCHHRQPREKGDRYGEPLKMTDLRRIQKLPVSCSTCHERPFNPRQIHVPGLKGAYHQLCLNCHRKSERPLPVNKPVFSKAAAIPVTKQRPLADCLTCHAKKGKDPGSLAKITKPKEF